MSTTSPQEDAITETTVPETNSPKSNSSGRTLKRPSRFEEQDETPVVDESSTQPVAEAEPTATSTATTTTAPPADSSATEAQQDSNEVETTATSKLESEDADYASSKPPPKKRAKKDDESSTPRKRRSTLVDKLFTPRDDALLIQLCTCGGGLGTKIARTYFGHRFELPQLKTRWQRLLRDEDSAKAAVQRIVRERVDELAVPCVVWTVEEEDTLVAEAAKRSANQGLSEAYCARILAAHRDRFHFSRTPANLLRHYQLMCALGRVATSAPHSFIFNESIAFSDIEHAAAMDAAREELGQPVPDYGDLNETPDTNNNVTKIESTHNEALYHLRQHELAQQAHDDKNMAPDDAVSLAELQRRLRDEPLAVLHGLRHVHEMRTCSLVLGRLAPDSPPIDVDVSIEADGDARALAQISRRQALILLNSDGFFYLKNIGKRAVYVNGDRIASDQSVRLGDKSLIEMAGGHVAYLFDIELSSWARIHRRISKLHERGESVTPKPGYKSYETPQFAKMN